MMTNSARYLRWIAGAGAVFFACGAMAADLKPAASAPAVAKDADAGSSPWQIRVRGLGVITNDSGSVTGVPGSDLSYSDTVVPELDISYYFTDNIAAELILGTTYANIKEDGVLGIPVGKTWLLPPTVTLQYHFTDFGAFKPYVGAGVNYSLFYNQSEKAGFHNLDLDNHFGIALQAGFDYMIDQHWGVNFDVKKIFLKTSWSADHDVLGPLSGKAKLDPWLIGTGVTYRF
ncbi:OmpW family protein [Neorhizobium lilium]|uniref:OmpW family protein n=1 Tax=Neorhizobium lilium TaxID=2503024 RepID=A0A444LJL5_9HYPH|nr:OmpW family protein [Neorhizobium lilium]RWX79137.1 OmpW family protein [Neorhizobium lilium]